MIKSMAMTPISILGEFHSATNPVPQKITHTPHSTKNNRRVLSGQLPRKGI